MEIKTLIILIIIGLLSGVIGGLIGVGGGLIILPSLLLLLNYEQLNAQGTSIAIMVFPIGIMAFFNYYRHGYVNIKHAIIIACVFVVSAYIGSKMALNINVHLLRKIFAIFMMVAAVRIFLLK